MRSKYVLLLLLFLILLIIPVSCKKEVKYDTEKPIIGGFLHMGPVLTLYKEGKYILSVFNNTDNIEIEYNDGKSNLICKFSISQPLPEGFLLETVCPEGKYKITCGGKTKFYNSYSGDRITITYR